MAHFKVKDVLSIYQFIFCYDEAQVEIAQESFR